jgi:hypothetical protein
VSIDTFLALDRKQARKDYERQRNKHKPKNGQVTGYAKHLNTKQVAKIKRLLLDGELTQRQIAAKFDTTAQTVHMIKVGKFHKQVEPA